MLRGISEIKESIDLICGDSKVGKMIRASPQRVNQDNSKKVLELLHVDLMREF